MLCRDKSLINKLHKFGVCCTYDEITRFKGSVAVAASNTTALRGMNDRANGGGLVQAIVDNFHTDTIHCLALLMTQANLNETKDETQTTIW